MATGSNTETRIKLVKDIRVEVEDIERLISKGGWDEDLRNDILFYTFENIDKFYIKKGKPFSRKHIRMLIRKFISG